MNHFLGRPQISFEATWMLFSSRTTSSLYGSRNACLTPLMRRKSKLFKPTLIWVKLGLVHKDWHLARMTTTRPYLFPNVQDGQTSKTSSTTLVLKSTRQPKPWKSITPTSKGHWCPLTSISRTNCLITKSKTVYPTPRSIVYGRKTSSLMTSWVMHMNT